MIGKIISHYKILEKLGKGGMGVVYKAQDTKLKRIVALKFLLPQALGSEEVRTRFVSEAQTAGALDHPNICTIYEIDEAGGQIFISMAYVEGQSVKDKIISGPLKLDEAIDIAIQAVEGLKEAHEKGVVHRDIKSANIMVTDKGQAKIMDFGLAQLTGDTQLITAGTTMGTVAYMSPEQASGQEVNHRTDIWSLGVVLYEMLTGQLPFKGEYEQAVVYSILNTEPEPITVLRTEIPEELERIVNKALAKSIDSRYQKAVDILADLRKLRRELKHVASKKRAPLTKPKPSIAVLPFTNLSADPEQEYFCDGMAEEIINTLAHVEGLRVVARTSAFSFRGRETDIREIGKKLNVGKLLEGSVRKAGNQLRITAQLVNVADGYHLWSEKYDRDIGGLCCPEDIFAIQDEISLAIVDKLKIKLLGKEKAKLTKRHTRDLDAYTSYLKGRYFWNKRTEESLKRSIEYFQQAIEIDPPYALAYSGLADSYHTLQDYSSISPKELNVKAREAARKALKIDDTLAEAHTSLGMISFRYWDWEGAERECKRAIKLNPNYPTAHHWYALVLMYMGRFDEAVKEMKRARELDTLSLVINRNMGLVLFYARRYDQAMDAIQKTLEMDPSFSLTHATLGRVYLQKSMFEEALAEFQKEKDLLGGWDQQLESWIGITYANMGKRSKARGVLADLEKRSKKEYVSPFWIAVVCFALEDNDQGFNWLNKAYQERDSCLLEIKVHPGFDSIRSDPRFKALLKKIGLDK